ncbi:MAG TPA: MFS transporter [Flavisolibacter sp.]|nr:MFS transporter [Flavisolibacter sp.]
MADAILSADRTKKINRIAVGTLFFLQGICFATWASRIPSIQEKLVISNSLLGIVLFALPIGSMFSLIFSGRFIARYGSKKVAVNALFSYALTLPLIGFATSVPLLITSLVLFGIAGNMANIAINTQAVHVEARYGKNIMASFHGLWSLAGFSAAGIGTFMIARSVVPLTHFIVITTVIIAGVAACLQYLIADEERAVANTKFFVKPDGSLVKLGILAFCCMICEGAMFDWSGIYFQKVVNAPKDWVGAGYTAFMCTMAGGRFIADWVANKWNFQKTITISGALITTGLAIAVLFPYVLTAIIGFLIVGLGVSSVIPLIYSEAGKSKVASPGAALTAVSSIGFLGFLFGPPLIGIIAGGLGLRIAFILVAVMGILVSIMVQLTNLRSNRIEYHPTTR